MRAPTIAGINPGKRRSISLQRDEFCISTPDRSERTKPASRSTLKCCDNVDLGTVLPPTVRNAEQVGAQFELAMLAKIRVNSINPGMIDTEGARSAGIIGSDFEKLIASQTPFGRTGQPDEIADIAVFLASKESRWLTGETLLASGGMR